MNKKGNAKRIAAKTSLLLFWSVLMAASWGFLLQCNLDLYAYRYLTISSVFSLVLSIFLILLPFAFIVLSIFFIIRRKTKRYILCFIGFALIWCIAFAHNLNEALAKPNTYSYTQDPANFGWYDLAIQQDIQLNPPPYFPSQIPAYAQKIQYCYYYQQSSSNQLYIAVSWQTDIEQLAQIETTLNGGNLVYNSNEIKTYWFTGNGFANAVILDYEKKQICYVIADSEEDLPRIINKAFPTGA